MSSPPVSFHPSGIGWPATFPVAVLINYAGDAPPSPREPLLRTHFPRPLPRPRPPLPSPSVIGPLPAAAFLCLCLSARARNRSSDRRPVLFVNTQRGKWDPFWRLPPSPHSLASSRFSRMRRKFLSPAATAALPSPFGASATAGGFCIVNRGCSDGNSFSRRSSALGRYVPRVQPGPPLVSQVSKKLNGEL